MGRGQLRLDSITGSYGTGVEDINDQTALIATGSANLSDIAAVFSHLASSIKRIHGHDSFSEAQPGVFKQNLQVTGTLSTTVGLSGSITKLADGTSYLIAGSNVTIVTGSNGAITISSTATGGPGGGDSFFSSTTNGSIFTTGSVAIRGGESAIDSPTDKGSDVFFYVSGSITDNLNRSLFGGHVVTSGSVKAIGGLSGSLTKLIDGTSYLIAGTNVTITTGSNGAVTITSTAAGGPGGGDSYFSSTTAGSVFTTGSAAFRGAEAAIDSPVDKGTDVFFYVSGSITDGLNRSLFGGHLVSSGSVKAIGGMSGSLTTLTDGTSYIIAGTGATVTTGSSGAVPVGVSPSYITSISWLVG